MESAGKSGADSEIISNCNTLEQLSSACRETYLTSASYWNLGKKSKIKTPRIKRDFFAENGITHAAFSVHKKGYYCEHSKKEFNSVLFTIGGECEMILDGAKSLILKEGSVCYTPAGNKYIKHNVRKKWEVLWFHVEDSPRWRIFFPNVEKLKSSRRFKEIQKAAKMYIKEAYSKSASVDFLEKCADLILCCMRDEFVSNNANAAVRLKELFRKAEGGTIDIPSVGDTAKRFGMSVYMLNLECIKLTSLTFSKAMKSIQMKLARRRLSAGENIVEVAKRCGFSDRHSFTRAYTDFYGKSPSRERCGNICKFSGK